MLSAVKLLRGFFFPVLLRSGLRGGKVAKSILTTTPLVLYRDHHQLENQIVVHSDICPHQGASLSCGKLRRGQLICPYHGFAFHRGSFCGIPDPSRRELTMKDRHHATSLPLMKSMEDDDFVYVALRDGIGNSAGLPHQPPEATNPDFVKIVGSRLIHRPQQMVTENVLDMLHISYVHSFGNFEDPLPKHVKYKALGEHSGRTSFWYTPQPGTLATFLGMSHQDGKVCVENEFHMPTTTITRVSVGENVKTVLTRAQPLDDDTCILFWVVYRNFARTSLFDGVMRAMMERTLDEDVSQLRNVYPNAPSRIVTGYDVTIVKYREAVSQLSSADDIRTE